MASVPTAGPPPPSAAGTPSAAATPAAAAAAAAPATAAPVPAIDPSSEESKDNGSDLLAGASHTSAEVLIILGSTVTHSKVKNVAATFGQ